MLTALLAIMTVTPATQIVAPAGPSCRMSAVSCSRLAELIATEEFIGYEVTPRDYTPTMQYQIYQLKDNPAFGEYPTEKRNE